MAEPEGPQAPHILEEVQVPPAPQAPQQPATTYATIKLVIFQAQIFSKARRR